MLMRQAEARVRLFRWICHRMPDHSYPAHSHFDAGFPWPPKRSTECETEATRRSGLLPIWMLPPEIVAILPSKVQYCKYFGLGRNWTVEKLETELFQTACACVPPRSVKSQVHVESEAKAQGAFISAPVNHLANSLYAIPARRILRVPTSQSVPVFSSFQAYQ